VNLILKQIITNLSSKFSWGNKKTKWKIYW